jgi:hypothetical protein
MLITTAVALLVFALTLLLGPETKGRGLVSDIELALSVDAGFIGAR